MTTRSLLAEREKTHGYFPETAAIAQGIKSFLRSAGTLGHVEAEALDMIATKLARIASGGSEVLDHWADVAGYAQLVVDHLEQGMEKKAPAGENFLHRFRDGPPSPSALRGARDAEYPPIPDDFIGPLPEKDYD